MALTEVNPVLHRTPGRGGYSRGCRCEECWAAESIYRRAREGLAGVGQRQVEIQPAAHNGRRCAVGPVGARLPWAPLAEVLRRRLGTISEVLMSGGVRQLGPSEGRMAEVLGVDRRQIQRWHHTGLSFTQADRYAVRAGVHPVEVWGSELWFAGVEGDQ